ncbi:MAG: hypothetical protein M0C28_15530 [Candidatus Moduliflexus flocculans]|nr:hypothetical protein [Candidatus Moduliflexus flocculans]
MKSSTTVICWARSSSFWGPFQMISTPASRAARAAPAWMDFQNSCVVPLGMTAICRVLEPWAPGASGGLPAAGRKRQGEKETRGQDLDGEGSHGLSIPWKDSARQSGPGKNRGEPPSGRSASAKMVPRPGREPGLPAASRPEEEAYFFFRMGIPVLVVSWTM